MVRQKVSAVAYFNRKPCYDLVLYPAAAWTQVILNMHSFSSAKRCLMVKFYSLGVTEGDVSQGVKSYITFIRIYMC